MVNKIEKSVITKLFHISLRPTGQARWGAYTSIQAILAPISLRPTGQAGWERTSHDNKNPTFPFLTYTSINGIYQAYKRWRNIMNLEGYNFIEQISEDKNGTCWLANKENSDKNFLITVINKNDIDTDDYNTFIENATKTKESKHTNIVNIEEIIEKEDNAFIITENITGKTIAETVEKDGAIPEKTALTIALCVAGMLETIHRKKDLTHGNISPANIIIDDAGIVKLAGLGIPFNKNRKNFFTAPEQIASKKYNALSDMYSLGTTIYFMLTANKDFDTSKSSHTETTISAQAIDIITKFTHTNPEERYSTWKEAVNDIEAAAAILPNTKSLPPITGINKTIKSTNQEVPIQKEKSKSQAKVPVGFRTIAWLLLIAFLGWFTYMQLTNPIVDKNKILPRKNSSATTVADNKTAVRTETEQIITNQKILNDIKKQLVASILANDITSAKDIIKEKTVPELKEETDKLLAIIEDISNPDLYIANIFSDKVGQKSVVMFGNIRREIIPIAISDVNITAKLISDSNSEPVTFSIKELPVREKLRIISTEKDETASIIKLLFNIKIGNIHEAKIVAKSCGTLAEEFKEQLNKQK